MNPRGKTRLGAIIRLVVFLLIVFFISTQMNSLSRLWDNFAEEVESLTRIGSETSPRAFEGWQPKCTNDDAMLRRTLEQTACASYHDDEDNSWRGRGPAPKIVSVLTNESEYNMSISTTAKPMNNEREAGDIHIRETRSLVKLLRGIGQACLEPARPSWNSQLISGVSTSKVFGAVLNCKQDKNDANLTIMR